MTILTLENVQKHFGAQAVLRGASLRIAAGEKVGMVGRNGGGKTTLLRLIEGLDQPDWGVVQIPPGIRIAHVTQRPEFPAGTTVRQWVESGLDDLHATMRELDEVNHATSEASGEALERLMKRHDVLSERIDHLGGWDTGRRVETVLSGIGLSEALWDREARTLSGGEKSRTALARELIAGSDLLLLDEPTNHLDLEGIEWLEAFLHALKSAVLVVSHDRRLLSRAVDSIVELERGELARYPGNYERYVELKAERYQAELRAWEQQQDFLRKEEQFIRQHMGSQRTAEAKGRQKKLESVVRLARPFHDVRKPVIRAPKADRAGEMVLEARDLSGGYGTKSVFSRASFRIARGERIGIVGRNGAGKTTLLRILAGRAQPLGGELDFGHRAACGYHDQDTSALSDDATPFVTMRRAWPQLSDQEIRDHLAKFLFRGDEVDAEIRTLSGGERARLCLARLVLSNPSWLALDEPTNHLDLAARTALEEMLGEFQGALVVVSHDREFLDGLCTVILEVDGGEVRRFEGNYSTWRAAQLSASDDAKSASRAAAVAAKPAHKGVQKPAAKSEEPKKTSTPGKVRNPWAFEKLEQRIITLEAELKTLQDALATEAVWRDAQKLKDTQMRTAEVERDLAEANQEWENWG
ncbi:MAG: ABC-F family ATP-binding cassette domain-containing protein [Planctomycetes bacterium]|nr:ABC-F family ATP-binding cassette domain-containing protein [Planctomycetota bacterium]